MGFTKLDEGILQSSIMAESPITFKVWISMLAACKQNGIAYVSSIYLSSVCHLPIQKVDSAILRLESPDPHSRSLSDDGRRIRRVDGGYEIINYGTYRDASLRDAEAERKRLYRKEKKDCPDTSGRSPDSSASVSVSASMSASEIIKDTCSEIDIRLVQLLIDLMQSNFPDSKTIQSLTPERQKKWIDQCRLLREADKRTPEQIEAVIRFSQASSFWKPNIQSMPKLREKWDILWMQMKRDSPTAKYDGIKEWLAEEKAKEGK